MPVISANQVHVAAIPPNNGAVLNITHIIKHAMASATEAELAALYIMARELHSHHPGGTGTKTTCHPAPNRQFDR
eukprot:CCRYP_020550-RA/>CCRYP_020550-RA protein AED:0.49 eAED:0.56 QI:0/0/0/1/0/0/2/0/74